MRKCSSDHHPIDQRAGVLLELRRIVSRLDALRTQILDELSDIFYVSMAFSAWIALRGLWKAVHYMFYRRRAGLASVGLSSTSNGVLQSPSSLDHTGSLDPPLANVYFGASTPAQAVMNPAL